MIVVFKRRMQKCLFLLAAMLLLSCSAQPQLPALAPDAVILAFGDSLTYGTGVKEQQSYPAVLSGLVGRNVVNAGIPGEVSAKGLVRLSAVLDEVQPDLVLLCHGGNDLLRKQSTAKLKDNLLSMVQLIRNRGIAVVLLAVPEPGLFLSPPGLYRDVAVAAGIPIETDVLAEILADPSLKSDRIHPNAEGYAIMAEALFDLLQESGAI